MQNQSNQSQQEDFINDPNLFLAVAMVKSINSLRDGHGTSSEDAAEDSAMEGGGAIEAQSLSANRQPDEMIEITPILDIIDKLEFKKTLSVQEVSILTTCLVSQFSDPKVLKEQAKKTKEFLTLIYYSVLNISTFSHHQNYLEQSAQSKFYRESLNFVKRIIDLLVKKESEPHEFNLWLPTISKLLMALESNSLFDNQYYRYMRSTHIRIDQNELSSLNQYLSELAPGVFGPASKKPQIKREEGSSIINLPLQLQDSDPLEKALEYVPADYSTLTTLLQEHLQSRYDLALIKDEDIEGKHGEDKEEKKDERKDIFALCQDHLSANKIIEGYSKVLDKLVAMTDDAQNFIQIDSSIFSKTFKAVDQMKLKNKTITHFIQKTLGDKASKIQKNLIKFAKEEASGMDVDSAGEAHAIQAKEFQEQIRESLTVFSKYIEILKDLHTQIDNKDKIKTHISKTFEDILEESNGFGFLSILVKLHKKSYNLSAQVLSLINSIVMHIFILQKENVQLSQPQIALYMQIITCFVKLLSTLHIKVEKVEVKKEPEKQQDEQKPASSTSSVIKTRGQLRKEQGSSIKDFITEKRKGKGEEQKMQASQSSSQSRKGITPDKEKRDIMLSFHSKLNKDEVFKTCISCLVMITPLYLKNQISNQMLMHDILENLIEITLHAPQNTIRVMQGILAEFTKPTVQYSEEAQTFIIDALCENMDTILSINSLTVLAIRLSILFKNRQDLLEKIGAHLIDKILKGDKKNHQLPVIKHIQDLYSGKQVNKYLLLSIITTLSQEKVKASLINVLFEKYSNHEEIKSQNMLSFYYLLEMCLFSDEVNQKFKPIIFQYMTKGQNEKPEEHGLIQAEIEKINTSIDSQEMKLYSDGILQHFSNRLDATQMINDLREKLVQSGKVSDHKQIAIQCLKIITKINHNMGSMSQKAKLLSSQDHSSIQLLIAELHQQGLDVNAQLLINSRLQRSIQLFTEEVLSKESIDDQAYKTIETALELLFRHYNASLQKDYSNLLKTYIDNEKYPSLNQTVIDFLNTACNIDQSQNGQVGKILSALNIQKQEEKSQVSSLIDPILCARTIIGMLSNQQEESIYGHCLSQGQFPELQRITSQMILMKSIFSNLTQLTQSKAVSGEFVRKMAIKLLIVKYDNKFLEYTENSSNIDHDTNDKLLKKSGVEKLNNKDFMWCRTFDKALTVLSQARQILQQLESENDKETRKLIHSIVKEVILSVPSLSVFKTNDDYSILNSYLFSEGEFSQIFRSTLKNSNVVDMIWKFAIDQVFENDEVNGDEVQLQKKGGVQLIISFNDKKGSKRSTRKPTIIESQPEAVSDDKNEKNVSNLVSEKFIQILIDILKEDQGIEQFQKLQKIVREQLRTLTDITQFILNSLTTSNNTLHQCFKKLFTVLVASAGSSSDPNENQQVSEYLLNQLVSAIHNDSQSSKNEETLITCLELAQVISDSNAQLIQFIRQCILPQQFESSQCKLLVLDFLCQLGIPQFSSNDNGNKYSPMMIQDKRQKQQQEKINNKKKKQGSDDHEDSKDIELKKTFQQEGLEGYKQDKVIKGDNFEKYMERPEEVCTYNRTKKDFAQQHWYFCYTCGLTGSNGCCAVCARRCHKGHHVIYSRKSNFFCDCGEGGKCVSLSPDAQAAREAKPNVAATGEGGSRPSSRRQQREALAGRFGGGYGRGFIPQPRDMPVGAGASSLFGQAPRFDSPQMMGYDEGDIDEDDAAIIFRQFGGLDRFINQANHASRIGQQSFQILSESSDEDMLREENDDMIELNEEDQQVQHPSMRGLMSILNRSRPPPQGLKRAVPIDENKKMPQIQKEESSQSSVFSSINPVEDPLSGASTPKLSQSNILERKDTFANFGSLSAMDNDLQLTSESLLQIIEQEKGQFEQVFTSLLELLEDQLHSQMEIEQVEQRMGSPSKRESKNSKLCQHKKNVTLCQDLSIAKKHIKEGSFQVKISDQAKLVTMYNINLHQCIDSSKDGIIALCEGDQVSILPSAHFFEEGFNQLNDSYQVEAKEGELFSKIDSQKLSFVPLQVKFNPSNQNFLAVAGLKDLQILTLNSKGKIQNRLVVDIMLEAFGKDLTIVNVEWIPGSQTMLAVGTQQFVKIYELSEDNLSPTHNLMTIEDQIESFTLTQSHPLVGLMQSNKNACNVIIATKNGNIFIQEITYSMSGSNKSDQGEQEGQSSQMNYEDNSQIILTQTINTDPSLLFQPGQPCTSVYYAPQSELLFATYEGGHCIVGKIEQQHNEYQLVGFKITPFDEENQNQTLKAVWTKNGECLSNFKELATYQPSQSEQHLYVTAISRKVGANIGLPCLIRISENSADIQIIKAATSQQQLQSPALGITFAKSSSKNQKLMRLIAMFEDGQVTSSNITHLPTLDPKGANNKASIAQSKFSLGSQSASLITKVDLPKEVSLSVNFFEKLRNVWDQADLRQQLIFTGDIVTYFKSSKQTFEHLSKINGNQPVINDVSKKSIKMILKMESTDTLITGIRIRVDAGQRSPSHQSFKILNRVIKFQSKGAIWYDIPLCDAEAIYGSLQNIDTEFITEDPKNSPIRIYAVEVFVSSKKDFNYKDKLRKLERQKEKQQESKVPQIEKISNEEAIKNEILKSTGMPLLTWKEKNQQLKVQSSDKEVQLILSLDVITQVLSANQNHYNKETLVQILDKLKQVYKQQLEEQDAKKSVLQAAVKRCLRVVLQQIKPESLLGDMMNYETIKDSIFTEVCNSRLNNNDADLPQIRSFIKELSKIYKKRHYQLFKIIETNPDIIPKIATLYLKYFLPEDSLNQEITDLLSIIFAHYTFKVNQYLTQTLGFEMSPSELVAFVYQHQDFSRFFNILTPFLLHKNEQVQKLSVSRIILLTKKYAKTMFTILKTERMPSLNYMITEDQEKLVKIMIVDFAPHLLRFLLQEVIPSHQATADVAYSLSYKLIKTFENHNQILYKSKIDLSQFLLEPLKQFITTQLLSKTNKDLALYEPNHQQTAQYVYANLVLVNILIHSEIKDEKLKLKQTNLGLDSQLKLQLISMIKNDEGSVESMIEQSICLLKSYIQGFKSDQCSIKSKYEDGIAIETYETQNGQSNGGGVQLLRPSLETSPWKWHPLFLKTNSIFELLDRKIPAQLVLLVQFLLADFTTHSEQLIQPICQLSQSKPAKTFLKQLGSQAVYQILIKQQIGEDIPDEQRQQIQQKVDQLKAQVKSKEFFDDFEVLFNKFILRKIPFSFNMQFHLHQMLEKAWKRASNNPSAWQEFLSDLKPNEANDSLSMLFQSAFSLNDESATICLALCALGLEQSSKESSIISSYTMVKNESSFDLAKVFAIATEDKDMMMKHRQLKVDKIDFVQLVDVLLLGKNKKSIRIASAHLLKGLFESNINAAQMVKFLLDKIPSLKQYGVNSQEFLAVLGYICNAEAKKDSLSGDDSKFISEETFKSIQQDNMQITAHPNLELYSTLQKVSSCFASDVKLEVKAKKSDPEAEILKSIVDPQMFLLNKQNAFEKSVMDNVYSKKITNPYMLETEACSKCYEQKSLPFQFQRLNEIKSETKFTDSCIIIKFNSTYLIKAINVMIHDIRGTKVVKTMNIFVNNKQGVDLADMRNNWSYWKRVKQVSVDIAQRSIDITFTLPIHATNILVEFQTVTLAKPIQPKQAAPPQQISAQAQHQPSSQGLDTVLALLPRSISSKLSSQSQGGPELASGSSIEKEQLYCPRCGKVVQGKHGNCASCGENALQCTFCRNINYEKLDAFLCNECGLSRYAKFDLSFHVKQGFASERIENEDQKNTALLQIESLLQTAQNNYTQLMKKRQVLSTMIKKINEGHEGMSAKPLQEIFGDECASLYQAMMKSLNTIKILKIEINHYMQGSNGSSSNSSQQVQQEISLKREASTRSINPRDKNNDDICSSTCFSCIQEHLKASLSFLEHTSSSLKSTYSNQGFLKLLYCKNLKMHSQSIQQPARRSICAFLQGEDEKMKQMLQTIEQELFSKKDSIPAHLLAQNIVQESQLVLDLLDQQLISNNDTNAQQTIMRAFWKILLRGFKEGEENSAIAEQIVSNFLQKIKEILKMASQSSNQEETKEPPMIVSQMKEMISLSFKDPQNAQLTTYFSQIYSQFSCNWLIESLIMKSSQKVREESKDIISLLLQQDPTLNQYVLKCLIESIDKALDQQGNANDQFFDCLCSLLSPAAIKEKIKSEDDLTDKSNLHVLAFRNLFAKIDKELQKLLDLEKVKETLGNDGFMPSISMGQSLSRLVTLISQMIKESEVLKKIVQQNVTLVIMSYLKIRKLNLTKNKTISNCEVEIEKMFKELHSEKEEEKEKFIIECMRIIESGDCDLQEKRFLFEEICKVIDPVKPDPVYFLNLNKAPSQEFFLRGKMSKNPYTSTSLGKIMGDARLKICKELELAEPELMELLVANKIIGIDLQIKSVYEQVWWPHICRQRNPDEYDIPSIDDAPKSSLVPMNVTYRLAGIDGEATEDRVESLQEGEEAEGNVQNEKKYQVTRCLLEEFQCQNGNKTNGIKVLLEILGTFGTLQDQKYLAEQLLKLIGFAIKNKQNRQELLQSKNTVSLLAKRLFESVGMQSSSEAQKGQTLFDVILVILESLVIEMNLVEDKQQQQQLQQQQLGTETKMEVDSTLIIIEEEEDGNEDAATHIELFIQIMEEACTEMTNNHHGLDKTSKKIRAVSRILPFLINKEDNVSIEIIRDFILTHLEYTKLDQVQSSEWSASDKFKAQFYLERAIEMLESTPLHKNFIKDMIFKEGDSASIRAMCNYLMSNIGLATSNETQIMKYKVPATYILKIINGLIKNHPMTQGLLHQLGLLKEIYKLSQSRFKDKTLTLLAQEIIENITNKNHINDANARDYLQNLIDQASKDIKDLASKRKEAIMKQMQQKKTQNKFLKQIGSANLQEEEGPKCIVCQDGYSKKPTEVLGMYVFTKKAKIAEISSSGQGFTQTIGYSTVTHSNFIHFTCHQNAFRVDSSLRQPKKEWEGAAIRNDHTKCNNLYPLKGGKLTEDAYLNVMDRYFQILVKTVGQCDNDRVKVVLHDFKLLMKRFAYEDSFSRDTHGGGPEHNMHLIPFLIQMLSQILKNNPTHIISHAEHSHDRNFTYIQERKLFEFLESGLKLKKDFMNKLEEEKKFEEIEEEEKFSEEMSSQQDDEEIEEQVATLNNLTLDQISYYLTIALVFTQMPRWEVYKLKFISIILCTVASLKDDKVSQQASAVKASGQQTEYATGKKLLTIQRQENQDTSIDVEMISATTGMGKRRRLMSDNKVEMMQKALFKLRPLLVQMRMVDQFKIKWDGKRLGLAHSGVGEMGTDQYLQKLNNDILAKDNLIEVVTDCDEMFREYKERALKIGSVEEFLQDMNLLDKIMEEHGSVEQFVMSHF